ncbi:hypothetical protein LACPH_000606 [Lacticaseibacillus parahuelsenbergensis]|uniref:Uncharacterized protein n=1 Tax=Lacticaseibacillus parahuelsenbergensis TaxID=3068305 RepID=A0ABY9L577_9LACO|nr:MULTISPECIES: hypothetical protein [Lacticaseibacillus]MDE3281698.1 hypothetical protein [Lacticaseibacillus casei]WLV78633.1 hypothetical protein LACPH_000606 [Lacticaseibacillus sp. NCIMB 15471]
MTNRRKTYLIWLGVVTLVAIANGIFKNTFTQVLVMVTACYALYQLLKIDHVFDRKKRRANRLNQ